MARKLNHGDVLERLAWLMATRGVPRHIRSDNGSEFTATAVLDWLLSQIPLRSIRLNNPQKTPFD